MRVESARGVSDSPTIWLPKVFCVFSPYLYYDKYVLIIRNLVKKL